MLYHEQGVGENKVEPRRTCRQKSVQAQGAAKFTEPGELCRIVRIYDYQARNYLKIDDVAGNQCQAMSPGGSAGVGQLPAVLPAQADGVLDDGFIEHCISIG
ncbi:hypothetical protein [Hymenobacter sp.]|uniref:hypothetical protein n=1 Tax=Hymenobacter sp. TaxID=1898978 RepID=UPI00286B5DF9|nr:hypothetical protein [Hymenobacter sp.]